MQKALNIIGWIGTALVFVAVAIRMFYPEWNQYATYAAWAGLATILIYMAGQWRDVLDFYGKRQARYGTYAIQSISTRNPGAGSATAWIVVRRSISRAAPRSISGA